MEGPLLGIDCSEAALPLSASPRGHLAPRCSLGHVGRGRTAMGHSEYDPGAKRRPWNAGRKLGAKRPLKPQQVWAVRFRLDQDRRLRDRAMFDLAIDSKLRGCDVVKMKIGDLVIGGRVRSRAIVVQQKTGRPVQFELLDTARGSILAWLERRGGTLDDFVFPSRVDHARPISTRSTPGWSMSGSPPSAYVGRTMARIRCAGPRPPSSTSRPATYAPCKSCSATPKSRAPCATSALTSRTR